MDPTRHGTGHESIIGSLRRRIEIRDLRNIEITFQMLPGPQSDGRVYGLLVRPGGLSNLFRTVPGHSQTAEVPVALDDRETESVLASLADALETMTPRSQAAFLPDSEIGMITVGIDGTRHDFFFLADPSDRIVQGQPLPEPALQTIASLQRITARFVPEGKG